MSDESGSRNYEESQVMEESSNGEDAVVANLKASTKSSTVMNGDSSCDGQQDEKSNASSDDVNGARNGGSSSGNSSNSSSNGENVNEDEEDMDEDSQQSIAMSEEASNQMNGSSSSPEKSSSRRKSPMKVREVEEVDDSDDASNDVEEVNDDGEEEEEQEEEDEGDEEDEDDKGSDSDVMEVEPEDPLSTNSNSSSALSIKPVSSSSASKISSLTATKTSAPNVVTIDDVRTLHKLASSAKKSDSEKTQNSSALDTSTILAGKATSGVTITPAKPKVPSSSLQTSFSNSLSSGVTISASGNKGQGVPLRSSGILGGQSNSTGFGPPDSKGKLNDPNLTDDTFVVEAPSFIVPYVYEKPPKESFEDFKKSIKKLIEEKEKEKEEEKEEEAKTGKDDKEDQEKKDDEEKDSSKEKKSDSTKPSTDDDEIIEVTKEDKVKKKSDNFFESALGKFLVDLGSNLVQETVQTDLLRSQLRKSQKDKSATVMHAIMSLRKNLESSKEHNEPFKFKDKKCRFCSFRTESGTVLQHHLETPHMKQLMYRCNFCPYETKLPQEVLTHMLSEHGVKGRLERAPAIHQCPQCPFEDNMKGKLTRHKNSCDKRFRPERNQEPPLDWEPPAKISKPPMMPRRAGMGGPMGGQSLSHLAHMRHNLNANQKNIYSKMPTLQMGPHMKNRPGGMPMMNSMAFNKMTNQMLNNLGGSSLNSQAVLNALNSQNKLQNNKILGNLASNSSVTIQSVSQRNVSNRLNSSPSISITPLPGRQSSAIHGAAGSKASGASGPGMLMKPGQPNKGGFVICEICDGYIKDLEQLRNHMLWIHKVKIHPKMIYNRPPLNCQKCQFRFFTDQGLERHLLGSHGLVTASMQELANKGQDSGRCPVCGKIYQWKLLNHVAKDHQKTLKPAHLSYKCTVCTATFGQYKLFENHVYQAHSGAAKKAEKAKQIAKAQSASKVPGALKLPSDITITKSSEKKSSDAASKKSKPDVVAPGSSKRKSDQEEIIELDDEEEEVNEVKDNELGEKRKAEEKQKEPPSKKPRSTQEDYSDEEGIEEIEDDPEDE